MKYRRDYQETHDIDWFFRYKGSVYHAASNGGKIPDVVDSQKNRELQERLEEIVGNYEVEFTNEARMRMQMGEELDSFVEYASKGFISLDRENSEDLAVSNQYHVVAFPQNGDIFSVEELLKLMPVLDEGEIEISFNDGLTLS